MAVADFGHEVVAANDCPCAENCFVGEFDNDVVAFAQLAGKAPDLVEAGFAVVEMLGDEAVAQLFKFAALELAEIAQIVPAQGDEVAFLPFFPEPDVAVVRIVVVWIAECDSPVAFFAQRVLFYAGQPVAEDGKEVGEKEAAHRELLQKVGVGLDKFV